MPNGGPALLVKTIFLCPSLSYDDVNSQNNLLTPVEPRWLRSWFEDHVLELQGRAGKT